MARPLPSVLVVDDDQATREGLTVLVESWGYKASEAADGKAALAACAEELPHAIVTDLMMPEDEWFGVRRCARREGTKDRDNFVTGQATVDTAVQAIKLGATIIA
jgi:CheY-like chemotaxis protein